MYAGIEITIGNRWKLGAVEKTRYTTFWLLKKTVGNEHNEAKNLAYVTLNFQGSKYSSNSQSLNVITIAKTVKDCCKKTGAQKCSYVEHYFAN